VVVKLRINNSLGPDNEKKKKKNWKRNSIIGSSVGFVGVENDKVIHVQGRNLWCEGSDEV